MNQRIIITGGTYAGKTSLVSAFAEQGYRTVPEAGMQIIEELNSKWGVAKQREWRLGNPTEFYTLIAERQATLEVESTKGLQDGYVIFQDRGIHDCVAFCRLAGIEVPNKILDLVSSSSYTAVFICEILYEYDDREESGRSFTRASSVRLSSLIEQVYSEYGLESVFVRQGPIQERLIHIKKHLN